MKNPKRQRCASAWGLRQHPVWGLEGCVAGKQTSLKPECPECREIEVTRDGDRGRETFPASLVMSMARRLLI